MTVFQVKFCALDQAGENPLLPAEKKGLGIFLFFFDRPRLRLTSTMSQ